MKTEVREPTVRVREVSSLHALLAKEGWHFHSNFGGFEGRGKTELGDVVKLFVPNPTREYVVVDEAYDYFGEKMPSGFKAVYYKRLKK